MNINKISENIETKKKEIIETTTLFDCDLLNIYYALDMVIFLCAFFYSIFFLLVFLKYKILGFLFFVSFFILIGVVTRLMPDRFLKNKLNKKLGFFYRINSFFAKNKVIEKEEEAIENFALDTVLDKDFLVKISENMTKNEFKNFLQKCEGKVTLRKLEKEISSNEENNKKIKTIEKLTDAIYEEIPLK